MTECGGMLLKIDIAVAIMQTMGRGAVAITGVRGDAPQD